MGEGPVELAGEERLDGGPLGTIAGVDDGREDGDMLGQIDVRGALVIGLVGVTVLDEDGEEGMLCDAVRDGSMKRSRGGDVESIVKLANGADDDGVVEAEVFTAYSTAFVGAWFLLSAAGSGCVMAKTATYWRIVAF